LVVLWLTLLLALLSHCWPAALYQKILELAQGIGQQQQQGPGRGGGCGGYGRGGGSGGGGNSDDGIAQKVWQDLV
jgi:uncharacterized membrane protein YgcG